MRARPSDLTRCVLCCAGGHHKSFEYATVTISGATVFRLINDKGLQSVLITALDRHEVRTASSTYRPPGRRASWTGCLA